MKYTKHLSIICLFALFSACNTGKNKEEDKNKSVTIEKTDKKFWPNNAQLIISISMQFETGGQPEGAESPFREIRYQKETQICPQKVGFVTAQKKEFTEC